MKFFESLDNYHLTTNTHKRINYLLILYGITLQKMKVAVDRLLLPLGWLESLGCVIGSSGGQVKSKCAVGSTIVNWYDCIVGINGTRKAAAF